MEENPDRFSDEVATFGDRVAAAREAATMSQAQLARRLGIKQSTLKSWEDDLSEPRANRLSMLAGLLGVSISWLISGQGEGLETDDDLPENFHEVLAEVREMRSEMLRSAEKLGRLEKRLRSTMNESDFSAPSRIDVGVFIDLADENELKKLKTAALRFVATFGYAESTLTLQGETLAEGRSNNAE